MNQLNSSCKFFYIGIRLSTESLRAIGAYKTFGISDSCGACNNKKGILKFYLVYSKGITAQNTRDGSEINLFNTSLGFHEVLWIYAWYCD